MREVLNVMESARKDAFVEGLEFRGRTPSTPPGVRCLVFGDPGLILRAEGLGLRVQRLISRVQGLIFRV